MKLPLFIIDAFTDRPLSGNPAAVCPLEEWLPADQMQAIAAEMNLSETVFFAPATGTVQRGGSDHGAISYDVRWFTPTREVDMIGHATLAAGHLALDRLAPEHEAARFLSPTAEITVSRHGEALRMNMPALVPQPVDPPAGMEAALGARPARVLAAKHYLAVYEDVATVAALRPDFAAVSALDLPAVIVTAPADAAGFDFVSRFFAPANGVPEDSVSGVAHCCLAPYWAARLGKAATVGRQLSRRGGTVRCEVAGERVWLAGEAAVFLEGTITL